MCIPRALTVTVAAAGLLISGSYAGAQTAFSTFGPGDTFSQTEFINVSASVRYAVRFVPSGTAIVNLAELGLGADGSASVQAEISITTEAASVPSSVVLASSSAPSVLARGVYAFTFPSITLNAGQAYWLVISASGPNTFRAYSSSPQVLGPQAIRLSGSPMWFRSEGQIQPAVRVTVGLTACCSTRTGACVLLRIAECAGAGLSPQAPGTTCSPNVCPPACPGDFNGMGGATVQDIFDFLGAWFQGC
jgi:hypothetical protein